MSKYDAVYFVGDNQAINRVRVDSSRTRNRGAFSGSLAALVSITVNHFSKNNYHFYCMEGYLIICENRDACLCVVPGEICEL